MCIHFVQKLERKREIPIMVTHESDNVNLVEESKNSTEVPVLTAKSKSSSSNTLFENQTNEMQVNQQSFAPPKTTLVNKEVSNKLDETSVSIHPSSSSIVDEARKIIKTVMADLENLEKEVETFEGTPKDKAYLWLEHELTNKLLSLDKVSASGTPEENDVRAERKDAVKRVQCLLDKLESKVE